MGIMSFLNSDLIAIVSIVSFVMFLVRALANVRYLYLSGTSSYWLGLIPFVNTWKLYGTIEESSPGKIKLVGNFEIPITLAKLNWLFSLLSVIPVIGAIVGFVLTILCKYRLYVDSYEYMSNDGRSKKALAIITLFVGIIWPIKVFLTKVDSLS